MIICINKNHPEVKQAADRLGLPSYLVAAKFSVWQSKNNNYDRFPTLEELNINTDFYQVSEKDINFFLNKWNINQSGFAPSSLVHVAQLRQEAQKLNLDIAKASNGNYYLTYSNGRKANIEKIKSGNYQVSSMMEDANENLDNIIKEYLDSIGVTVEELDEITDSQGNPLNVIARAKLLDNLIQVVKGKSRLDTLSEEAAHFAVRLLGKDNPLFNKMMKDITKYEIYKATLAEYSSFVAYQNEDGTSNIDKIKEEAIGKLIANHIVKQFKGEETEANIEKANRWFDNVLNVLKRILKNVGLTKLSDAIRIADNKVSNPYKDIASEILSGKTSKKNNQTLEDSDFYQAGEVSQKSILTSLQELQSKIIKDETGAKGERYEVLGEKGYKSPTEMVEEDYNKRFAGSTQTKEDIEKNEREKQIGLLKHAIVSELIREAFPNENKHLKPIESKYSSNPIYSILKSKLNTRSSDSGIETIADIIAEAKKDGSIVLSEVMVANTTSKRAGTIDILIIRKDGTLDIYDVKPGSKSGIHKNKMKGYNLQINEYVKILEKGDPKLGILPSKVAKKRIIPISNTYTIQDDKTTNTKKYFLKSFEYNNSIPTGLEKTGIVKIDEMIDNFRTQIEILERKLTKQTDEKEKEKIKDFISTRETYISNLQKQRTLASILPAIQRDLLIIEDLLTDDNFDPSLNWQDIKDSLKLYTNLNSILSDEELKTKKDHAVVDSIVGTAKRLEGVMLKIATNIISDNLTKQQILGQNGIVSPEDALQPQVETSMWSRFWLGVSKSENPLVASVYKMVTKALEKSRQDSYTLKNKIKAVIDKNNLTSSDFDRMLQIDDEGNKTGNLVAPVKYSYWLEFNKALRSNNDEWFTKNTIKDDEKYKTSKKNYEEVLKGRKKYDIVEILGNLNKSDKYKDRTQDELLLIADNIWEKKYNENIKVWEERNKNNNKFRKPKMEIWADPKYLEIQNDSRLKEFYDLYTKTMDDVSEFLPMKDVRSNFIPNFTKQFVEKAMDIGFLEAIKQLPKEASESLQFTMDEKEYGLRNPITGERVNDIPVLGAQEMVFYNREERREFMDKRKSYDLGQVLYTFIDSAYRYRELKEVENTALITLDKIKETQAIEAVMPDGTKKMKADNTNTYNHLKDYIDTVFYGRAKEEGTGIEIGGKRYGLDKAFDKVIAYTSLKNLGLNLFAPVVDHLGNITNASFAAITGKYYSTKNFGKAYKYATLGNGGITENDKKAKLLMEKFDIVTGFFGREYAKELTAYKSKKIFDTSHFYSLYKVSEFALQNSVMMAMMLEGKYGISFNDYTIKDGELVWNNPNKPEPTTEEIAVFRQKVLHVIKNITGNLDPNDKAAINRTIMGRLLMQHRNWIPRQFESRWGAKKYDYVLETWVEGRYRTLLREGFGILRGKKKFSELSEMEKSNLKGVLLEMAVITALIGLVTVLKSDDGDDDDTWFERYVTRISDRLVSELTFFVSLGSAMEILKSPMATSGTLEDGMNWFKEVWKALTGEDHKLGKKSRRFIVGWGRLEYFYDYVNGDIKK